MSKKILEALPQLPGIYVFKNKENALIYIGKAKCLYKRVSSYFSKQNTDWKVQELIKEHTSIDYIITKSEIEALLLEVQLIQKYKPKYNVLLKSGNPFVYLLITEQDLPVLKIVRTKKEKGYYFGPFLQKQKARSTYEYLVRTFKLRLCSTNIENGCLNYHLQRCAGNCMSTFNKEAYKTRILLAQQLLEGNYEACKTLLNKQIKLHNEQMEFEISKNLYKYLATLEVIFTTLSTRFSETSYAKDVALVTLDTKYKIEKPGQALEELQILLHLEKKPASIDCFDISHFQSSYLVGSCVRFTHGIPDKNNFRRFKIKSLQEQNDYAALQEIVSRRYKDPKNLPDVVLIDGGKGQLSAITSLAITKNTPCISLAKREETLFAETLPVEGMKLHNQTPLGQLLLALRDYAHHFAISYHKILRSKNFTHADRN